MGSGMDTGARGLRWWKAGQKGEPSPQGTPVTPWAASLVCALLTHHNGVETGGFCSSKTVALLGQEAEKSTSSAREPSLAVRQAGTELCFY